MTFHIPLSRSNKYYLMECVKFTGKETVIQELATFHPKIAISSLSKGVMFQPFKSHY